MVIAFGITGPIGSMSYAIGERWLGFGHAEMKYLHAFLQLTAVICGFVGIWDMWVIHEKIPWHFQSVHSWIGIWIFISYVLQFISGFYLFLISSNGNLKKLLVPYHRSIGRFLSISCIWIIILGELILKGKGHNNDSQELMWKTLSIFLVSMAMAMHFTLNYKAPETWKRIQD